MAYADDVELAAELIDEASAIVDVPPWVVVLVASFVARRGGVATEEAADDIRASLPGFGR